MSTNSITLYNKYNKHSKKMTKKGTFFKKNMTFFRTYFKCWQHSHAEVLTYPYYAFYLHLYAELFF